MSNRIISTWGQVVIGFIVFFFLIWFMQCMDKKKIKQEVDKAVQAKHISDSIEFEKKQYHFDQEKAKMKEKIDSSNFRYDKRGDSLDKIIEENRLLLSLRKKITKPANDTGVTMAPNEFIDDCETCFTQLQKTTDRAQGFKFEADAMKALFIEQSKIDSANIAELQVQKVKINKDYNDLRISVEAKARDMRARRSLKIGAAGMLDGMSRVGIGTGIMYQDLKNRNFGGNVLFSESGRTYIVYAYLPIIKF